MDRNKLLQNIPMDKIQIKGGKGLIRMNTFLSFLTVDTHRPENFLGKSNGWTQVTGEDGLIIKGGVLPVGKWPDRENIEYIDSIQYKDKMDNPYNSYVNPFYLFEIMNQKGKDFFLKYYKEDITLILSEAKLKISEATKEYEILESLYIDLTNHKRV